MLYSIFVLFAIFSFIIVLFLASLKIIDRVFTAKKKLQPDYMQSIFAVFALFLWFIFSAVSTIVISAFFLKLPQIWSGNTQRTKFDVMIEKQDCPKLIDTIYSVENKIYQSENHRYIEEVAPIFTIKLEYEKGAKKLNSVAQQYLALDVGKNSQFYTQQLAQKMQEKAQLFQTRTEITENSKGVKQILNLLAQMDRLTQEKQNLIENVKKQCQ